MTYRISYISPKDVRELIEHNTEQKKFIIIDVRGSDVEGLIIHGAINIPCNNFIDSVSGIVGMYHTYDYIIVHCGQSQNRGPHCAYVLNNAFENSNHKDSKTEIKILTGGFNAFYNNFMEFDNLFDKV